MSTDTRWEYHVTNSHTGQGIEKHFGVHAAEDAAKVCNDHERRNQRPPIYIVIPKEIQK